MATIAESRHSKVLSTRPIFGQRPAVVVGGVLLLVTLLAAGCGQTTATPTAILPPVPLSWESVSLPPGNLLQGLNNLGPEWLSVAPNDGTTAYACAAPVSLSVGATIWVTHDRAQHWTRLAPLPAVAQQLTNCWVVPDAVNPAIAVAELSWAPMTKTGEPASLQGTHFVTVDGGEHWQPLRGPKRFDVRWMATYQGTTIAQVEVDVPGNAALWISHDQMQTWQSSSMVSPIDGLYGISMSPSMNPTTGDLLLQTQTGSSRLLQLEESKDDGQHWTAISTPLDGLQPATFQTVVSPPVAGQPWRICGLAQYTDGNSGILMCSMDGGKTWTQRPQYQATTTSYKGHYLESANEVAVGPDGTVYATMGGLDRLAPGSDQWQSLGPLPQDQFGTAELPGAGIFWIGGRWLYNA